MRPGNLGAEETESKEGELGNLGAGETESQEGELGIQRQRAQELEGQVAKKPGSQGAAAVIIDHVEGCLLNYTDT